MNTENTNAPLKSPSDLSPTITVTLEMNPPSFYTHWNVEVIITATTNVDVPITIYAFETIFNLDFLHNWEQMQCIELDTKEVLAISESRVAEGFRTNRLLPHFHRHHHTLEPRTPTVFKHRPGGGRFRTAAEKKADVNTRGRDATHAHRYQLRVKEGAQVLWWREGRREEWIPKDGLVQEEEGLVPKPIDLVLDKPIEFEVLV